MYRTSWLETSHYHAEDGEARGGTVRPWVVCGARAAYLAELLRQIAHITSPEEREVKQSALRYPVEACHPSVEFEKALRIVLGRRTDHWKGGGRTKSESTDRLDGR